MLDENRDEMRGGDAVLAHVGHGWREIDRQMRRIAKRRAALDAEEAPVLLAAITAEVHVHLGYGSVTEYLERACGYAPRTARERVRVAEALRDLPALSGALAAGEVCFSAVKEMSRVLTAETEDEWLAAVAGCTVREIEDEMRGRQAGDRPGDRPDPSIEPRRVRLELSPEAYASFLEARRALERETGEPMTDSEFMTEACRRALSAGDARRGNTPSHTIAVTTCRDCKRAWQETGSKSIELSPAALERARCDAFELGDVDGPTPAPITRSIPAPVRRAVLARDHRRCRVPGCNSSQYVDVHHLVHRSVGGPHALSNLITLCGRHHTAAHVGRILITGTAGALVITHADGRPYGMPPAPLAPSPPLTPTAHRAPGAPAPLAPSPPLTPTNHRAPGAPASVAAPSPRITPTNHRAPGAPASVAAPSPPLTPTNHRAPGAPASVAAPSPPLARTDRRAPGAPASVAAPSPPLTPTAHRAPGAPASVAAPSPPLTPTNHRALGAPASVAAPSPRITPTAHRAPGAPASVAAPSPPLTPTAHRALGAPASVAAPSPPLTPTNHCAPGAPAAVAAPSPRITPTNHRAPGAPASVAAPSPRITLTNRRAPDAPASVAAPSPRITPTNHRAPGAPASVAAPSPRITLTNRRAPDAPASVAAPSPRITPTDRRAAGAPASVAAPSPRLTPTDRRAPAEDGTRAEMIADAGEALVGMGVKRAVATRAVEHAMRDLGETPTLEDVLRASRRELHPAQSIAPGGRCRP